MKTKKTAKLSVFFVYSPDSAVFKLFMLSVLLVAGNYAPGSTGDKVERKMEVSGMTGTVKIIDADKTEADKAGIIGISGQSDVRQADSGREALIGERELLHKKLIEMMERYQKQNEDYRRLRLSIAATLASGEKNQIGKREDQLMENLAKVSEDARRLALKAVEFCDYVENQLKSMPLGQVQKAEFNLKLDDLRGSARKAWYLVNPSSEQPKVTRCRLLAVDDDLQIVVLPVGLSHGVFCGLNLFVGKDIRLRIIVVKPFFSAAMVTEGSIKDLAPGMEARTDEVPTLSEDGTVK